ncbi:FxSxx-COOH system tetratricopeptide repeat protein [Streptomyces atrovirens]|uniref:FxSxx-COOH system tetratricopeptide repeat protein n=1 Tax=Streptomyces atrovirens TaxID=285556 RepID=A0ABW0DK88_9ACTN
MNGLPRERAPGPEEEEPAGAAAAEQPLGQPAPSEGDLPGAAPHWHELADALWLAAQWSRAGRTAPESSAPVDDDWAADAPPPAAVPPPDAGRQPVSDDSAPGAAPTRPVLAPEGRGPLLVESPLLPGAGFSESDRPARRSALLSRSLHRLGRRVESRHELLLDEELTAERMVADELWIPSLRPGRARAFHLVVLVDDGPTMAIWQQETAALSTAAEHSGAFRSLRTVRLNVPGAGAPTLRWSAAGRTADLGEIVNGRQDRMFLIVTDGLGPGWAAPSADHLLRLLGHAGPTALLHLLPPHLRRRSSLHPHDAVLESGGFGATNRGLFLGPPPSGPDPLRPLPQVGGEALVVPVLSMKPGSLAAWADLVVGERGVRRALPAVVAGSLHKGKPAPGLRPPRFPRAAHDAVRTFLTLATPSARRLAAHLAAVPFEFDLIQQLRGRMMPDTTAEHLAEILMGGLIDWNDADAGRPEFADGVRQALLATTTRTQLARVVGTLAELPAAGEQGAALRAALYDPSGAALPDPGARGWRQSELAVMRALGGVHAQRARRIQAAGATDAVAGAAAGAVVGSPPPAERLRTDAFSELGEPADEAAVMSSGTEETERSPAPAVTVNIPLRNLGFVGRAAQLRALADRLATQDTVCLLPDAVHGSGAVGTSELALEYVYRHLPEYDLVCWIPAQRDGLVLTAFADLAAVLGVDEADRGALSVDSTVPAVLRALRTGTPYHRWLLVFDNAEDVEAVRRHLPADGRGKVLVTSRDREWERVAAPVTLSVFEREESVALLRNHVPALPAEDADRLAEALGDQPLALEQAGAWLEDTGLGADVYLGLFQRHLVAVGALDPDPDRPSAPAAAWNASLEWLGETHPDARRLLDRCAVMAPEPIPLGLLHAGRPVGATPEDDRPGDPVGQVRAVRALGRLALVKVDHRTHTLRLHRLLHTLLLARMTTEQRERTRETAHRLLAAARPGHYATPQEWPAYRSLLPHLLASQAVTSTDPRVRAFVHDTVRFLHHRGDLKGATALGEQARTAWPTASGEENGEVVRMTKTYAMLLRRAGRIAESAPLTENALEVSRRIAADSEELVDSLCELADTRRHQGRFREARDLGEEATELARSLFGDEAPLALRATHDWGIGLRLCGQYAQALPLDQENARRCGLLFRSSDPLTFESLNAVAADMRESGDYPGARAFQEGLYRWARSELGEEHPLALRTAGHLAVCRRRDGALAEAALLSEETLGRCTDRYGPDHPESLSAAIGAAVDRRLAGDLDRSRRLDETTAQRLAARLGEDHLCTLVARAHLAAGMRALGLVDQAREMEDDVSHRLETTLGPRHTATLTLAIGRSNTAYTNLEFERAREIDEVNLRLLAEVAGERHPLTLSCTTNLALDLRGLGRGAEADELQRTAMEGFSAVVRADHPWLTAARQRRRIECDLAYIPL